jgi:hypothetical protein
MSGVFMFLALGERPGGKLKQTAFFLINSERLLFDLARAIDHRRDQPDDVVFEWAEPAEVLEHKHPERSFSRRNCLTPNTVLPGLKWLQVHAVGDEQVMRDIRQSLQTRLNGHPALEPGRFEKLIHRDINGLIAFCEHAEARGDYVVAVRVP